MAGAARLFPASPKPAGGPITPAVRSPKVRFAKAARDQRFLKVIGQLQQSARKVGQHPSAKRKADEAQAAAKAPANEKEAGARANQVDDMKDAKAEKPNKGGFLAILRAEIDKVMPKTLDDADKFMKGGESQQIKGAVGGNVSEQKQKAAGPTETATKAPPDTGKVEGKEVSALPADPAAAPDPVAGAAAMPAPKPQVEVAKTATDASASADKSLTDAKLNDRQLKRANDPRFSAVLTTRDKAKETAAAGPAKFRAAETKGLNQARAGAMGDAAKGVAGLAATKNATSGKNKTRAQLAKEKDEADRKKVTDTIAAIFEKTKSKVDEKLSTLEADAMALFDAGADAALATMKSSANQEIDRFKDDRYSGLIGKGRWVADLFSDTPKEIKDIIARARARFTVEMDALAVKVAAIVDDRLAQAKAIVAAGQKEVKTFVAGLAPNLRAVGQAAEQDIQSKFDDLKQSIDDKAQDLAEKLAQKYKDASEKADTAAKEMEEANKGALRALAEKVGEIVKMLAEFADRVVALFKKAAGVLSKIIDDPIGFLGNLLSAIKQGISQFVSNIWTHIKRGFMTWLFGELTKGGVQIPEGLPAPGAILKLVLNVMGLTWANIRPKIVAKVGERAVAILEKVVEILQKLFTGGVDALWAELQAFVGNLKSMVLDAILDWVINKVITSAITKVASMFNPAGAIIQAIIMVYNVGSWLVANIGKILDFIESVVNSVDRIANGDVGGAASFIEQSLAKMIPILIGFLAGLLGLGGLGDKIKSFIQKVQAKVGKAVDFVIDKVFNAVKKIIGKLTGKDKKDEKSTPGTLTPAEAVTAIKKRASGVGGQLARRKNTDVGGMLKAFYDTESKWVEQNVIMEGGKKPRLLVIPQHDEGSYWLEIKINPVEITTKWPRGTGGQETVRGKRYIGMFHGSLVRIPSLPEIDMSKLEGGGDGKGLELGAGLYLTHYFSDVKGYAPRPGGWVHRILVPEDILKSATVAAPNPSGGKSWESAGEVVKGTWLHIGTPGWKAGFQWCVKSEKLIKERLILDAALPILEAADKWGRGRMNEFPDLRSKKLTSATESTDSGRKLAEAGAARNPYEAGGFQEKGESKKP